MVLEVYAAGAAAYALLMAGYSTARGFRDRADAEIFGTVASALLWPITMPIDLIAFVRRKRARQEGGAEPPPPQDRR